MIKVGPEVFDADQSLQMWAAVPLRAKSRLLLHSLGRNLPLIAHRIVLRTGRTGDRQEAAAAVPRFQVPAHGGREHAAQSKR